MVRPSIKLAVHGMCCRECRTEYETEVNGGLAILRGTEIRCAEYKKLQTQIEKGNDHE